MKKVKNFKSPKVPKRLKPRSHRLMSRKINLRLVSISHREATGEFEESLDFALFPRFNRWIENAMDAIATFMEDFPFF
ncbi:hypothetical protein [Corynebacterium sp. 13CS0277]|uniref:hypothetical protein n=1 Tax=Corynebacterium sp. 13CS0277 TaxID=2071994 RepID=UPI0011B238AA|nr:hypothetical protein [Corynebacterium sp. 13CS0277]